MSERTKAEIARENGRNSKGPISIEGKQRSSANGLRHGLTANQNTLLSMENAEEYDEVLQSFIEALRPGSKAELRIVQRIANIDWRLERLVMMETCLQNIDAAMNCEKILARFGSIDAIGIVVEAWKDSCKDSSPLELLRRYQATLSHQMDSTNKMFEKLEARRIARKHAGLDLDDENYQVPEFEKLRDPKPTEVGEDLREGDIFLPDVPKDVPQAAPPIPIRSASPVKQSEPTTAKQIKPVNRPAA